MLTFVILESLLQPLYSSIFPCGSLTCFIELKRVNTLFHAIDLLNTDQLICEIIH